MGFVCDDWVARLSEPSGHKISHREPFGVRLERRPEITGFGVFVSMFFEIVFETFEKALFAHLPNEHKHKMRTLGIDNTGVKKSSDFCWVGDIFADGLDALNGITIKSGETVLGEKIVPNLIFWEDVVGGIIFHDGSERFVEPEVVPPFHGDEVAKPLVREFVGDGESGGFFGGDGRGFVAEELGFAVGDKPPVFHGASLKVGDGDLVEFFKRVFDLEEVFVVVERFDGDGVGEL